MQINSMCLQSIFVQDDGKGVLKIPVLSDIPTVFVIDTSVD